MRGVAEGRGESEDLQSKSSEKPTFPRKVGTPSDLALLGHLKVNCPEGAREATLGCPRKRGRQVFFAAKTDRFF